MGWASLTARSARPAVVGWVTPAAARQRGLSWSSSTELRARRRAPSCSLTGADPAALWAGLPEAGDTADVVTVGPPRLPAGERLRRAGVAAWSIIGLLILLLAGVWLLLEVRVIFPPLVLALLIIYVLNPIVARLEKRGVPRPVGAVLTYVLVGALITFLVMALAPIVSRQANAFAEQWPQFRGQIVAALEDSARWLNERGIAVDPTQAECLLGAELPEAANCDRVVAEFRDRITGQVGRLTEIGLSVLEGLLVFVLAPLIALYLLIDLPQVQRDLLNLVPESHRAEAADLGSKIARAVGGFFRGQLFVALIVGVLSALGFRLIGLPFWLVIGAIAGFFNLIPLVGPFVGGAIGFLVGSVSGGVGLGLKAALVELVVQQLDNHVISPQVMKRAVQLHPATVVLALLAGATVAGFWGVLLAVPFVAVTKLLLGHFWETRVLGAEVTPYAVRRGAEPPSVVPDR